MKKYESYKKRAEKYIKRADHVLNVTYPLVQEPKILKYVLVNVYKAVYEAVAMILYYERERKNIVPFHENYDIMLTRLPQVLRKHKLSLDYIKFLKTIGKTVKNQKEAPVEFVRKDKFVFASRNYNLEVVSDEQIKDYLIKAKFFINQLLGVVNE